MSEFIQSTIKFIRDYYNTDGIISLHEPKFLGNEKSYLLDAIDSTFVSSIGPYVDKLEERIAQISGTHRAVAVVNGTAALQASLRVAGVCKGDEVITQALTFVATANAISFNGANPVFLDVDLDTMGLSPKAVQAFLEEYGELRDQMCYNKKTGNRISACVPMHTYGFPVHLNEILEVCKNWKIPIIEDAAESLGSLYQGKPTGSFGTLGIFSFNGNKIVTAGGGGAIVTNDRQMGDHTKHLTTTAKRPHPYEFAHDEIGYNFRMPNLNAALLCAQLENLNQFIENKRELAYQYEQFFSSYDVKFKKEPPYTRSNYWLMCVELNDRDERDHFLKETNECGVMTRPVWKLMHKLPMYEHCERDQQKNAEYLSERIVNIPSSVIID